MNKNQLLAMLAIVSLASCGSGGGNKSSAGLTGEPKSVDTPPVQVAAKAALSILIPQAIADEATPGTTYIVRLAGPSSISTREIPAGKTSLTIGDLEAGDYTIDITARSGSATVALGSATAKLDKPNVSVQVPIKYVRGNLLVEVVQAEESTIADNLSGKYSATAKMSGCIRNSITDSFVATDATVTIQAKSSRAKVTLELFPKTVIEVNGDVIATSGATTISGTYSASTEPDLLATLSEEIARTRLAIDLRTPIGQTPVYPPPPTAVQNAGAFSSGNAITNKLVTVGDGSIYFSLALKGECETSVFVTGFKVAN